MMNKLNILVLFLLLFAGCATPDRTGNVVVRKTKAKHADSMCFFNISIPVSFNMEFYDSCHCLDVGDTVYISRTKQ